MKTLLSILTLALMSLLPFQLFSQTNTFPSSGNVGIGTTSPNEKLEVVSTVTNGTNFPLRISGASYLGSEAYGIGFNPENASGLYKIKQGIIASGSGYGYGWGDLHFLFNQSTDVSLQATLSDSKVIFKHNGNVGIGTTNPSTLLYVDGGDATLATFDGGSTAGNIAFLNGATVKGYMGYGNTGNIFSGALSQSMAIRAENALHLGGSGNNLTMTLTGGNVGIGTTTPAEKLSVNGTVRSKEVKVEIANWPDYVFDDGYKVGRLEELESYIKANKHLPGIPSAKQVEKEGISLGEMNAKLLQKIEEMTLQIIEMNRRIKELETKK